MMLMAAELSESVHGERVLLQRLTDEHAEALNSCVAATLETLEPWMPWTRFEPMTVKERGRLIHSWRAASDHVFGVFVDSELIGICGLHRRIGAGGIEIGYWLDQAHTHRGYMTEAVTLATGAAFADTSIDVVEIHHDRANEPSRAIPERIGYSLISETPTDLKAPSEIGVEVVWRVTRTQWLQK